MRTLENFLSDEQGAVTIEFVTLVPAFVMILVFFTDASILYLTHSEMFNAARDIARRMSTGQITTRDQALTYAVEQLKLYERTYLLETSDMNRANKTVTISIGVGDAAIFGYLLTPVLGRTMTATATMRGEPLDRDS